MHEFLTVALDGLEKQSLRRGLRCIDGAQARALTIEGKEVLNFCSNNYLGLANDKRLSEAAIVSMKEEGFGSGASRLVCGNMKAHRNLEEQIAKFKGTESALVFSCGYMANVGIIPGLFGRGDLILSDKLNHASIIDGILLSGAEFKRYAHNDMDALEELLKKSGGFKKRAVITDSVFSMDGDLAPLTKIVDLAKKYDAITMIDEAHAFGVFGKNGEGLAHHLGVADQIDIHMGTLSKAAGSFGAYVCGSRMLIDFLINKARSFIYTTGMPPSVAAASSAAVQIIEKEPERRQKLWDNTRYLTQKLQKCGFDTMNTESPIIPVLVKDAPKAVIFSQKLFERGVFASAIRPPTVPLHTARLRVTVMATHTRADLDFALEQFESAGKELCLI